MAEKNNDPAQPSGIRLSQRAIDILDRLFSTASPQALRDDIVEIYHTYLIHVHETLPLDFDKMAMNIYLLINALSALEKELKQKPE